MSAKLKIAAYVVLVVLSVWFGWRFHKDYTFVPPPGGDSTSTNAVVPKTVTPSPAAAAGTTNTGDVSTNALAATNDATGTNLARQAATPELAATNTAVADNSAGAAPSAAPAPKGSSLVGDLVAFVLSVIGLGLLIAYDATQIMGSQAVDFLFNDKGDLMRDPEYERAEGAWANGKHLEAVEMMREYLKKNPREQYVALRIAEIYEKDLRNFVAASLEYEEILKKKLPAERWGWAAIHLCNIYAKLGQPEKVTALLQRIAHEYPKTGAAKKARAKLGLPEPEEEAAPVEAETETASEQSDEQGPVFDLDEAIASTEGEVSPPEPEEAAPEPPPEPEPPAKPSLPRGFRPKK